ncbi:hypothetical protein ABT075_43305 [Streptomyces sp. NPDC002677]|uniref:hypothetical protein n=1 Tax=Streptomyces sp. NPDC002677 TaxID=3154774 RepID=UPI003330381C
MTTSVSYAHDTLPVAERADRLVVARHRPEARAALGGRVIVEDRLAGSPEMRTA